MTDRLTDDNEALEAAYWRFDSLVRGHNAERKRAGLGPMEERMAFKSVARELIELRTRPAEPQGLTAEEREALKWLVKHVNATTMPGVRPRRDKERAIAVLDRLLAAEVRR